MSNFAIYTNSLIFLANTNSVLLQRAQKPLSIYIKDSCEMWLNSMQNFLQKSPAPLPWKIWMQMGPYWMKTALTPFSLPKRWVALSIYIKDSCKTMWLNSMHFFGKTDAPLPKKIWMQMGPYWRMKTALTPFSLPICNIFYYKLVDGSIYTH